MLLGNVGRLKDQGLDTSVSALTSMGFGRIRTDSVLYVSSSGAAPVILVANIPQLILSIGYLLINRLITTMAASREWALFAHQKKGLRVTSPSGDQRSTYWLQLPFKICIPLLVLSVLLHYVVSQSFFLVSLDITTADGQSSYTYAALGYSVIAQFTTLLITAVIIVTAILLGIIRNPPGIPPARACSAIISAACHPPSWDVDAAWRKIQWGDVGPLEDSDGSRRSEEFRHCSFSSGDIKVPTEGWRYL